MILPKYFAGSPWSPCIQCEIRILAKRVNLTTFNRKNKLVIISGTLHEKCVLINLDCFLSLPAWAYLDAEIGVAAGNLEPPAKLWYSLKKVRYVNSAYFSCERTFRADLSSEHLNIKVKRKFDCDIQKFLPLYYFRVPVKKDFSPIWSRSFRILCSVYFL